MPGRAMLFQGDCLDLLATMADDSIDSAVLDPPYGLGKPPDIADVLRAWMADEDAQVSGGGFMGKEWDAFVPGPRFWKELHRVLKPGAHAVVFAGQRTVDLMGIALRLGGFDVRDLIGWQYWSGFPKNYRFAHLAGSHWEGWGTALKPSIEPAILVRKPLIGTVAENVLKHGTGGLNIDGCRYPFGDGAWPGPQDKDDLSRPGNAFRGHVYGDGNEGVTNGSDIGRWPANVYACPKPSTAERERGCDGLAARKPTDVTGRKEGSAGQANPRAGMTGSRRRRNIHPTVKPVRLLRWLCRLVTPPGGKVLDMFMGSGSCGVAATLEGFRYAGAEMGEEYFPIAHARIRHAEQYPGEWLDTTPGPPMEKAAIEEAEEYAELIRAGQAGLFSAEVK